MSWRAISITDVRLSPAEVAAMQNLQGSTSVGAAVLLTVVRELVGAAQAGGYAVATDGTVPDCARLHVINRTRWLWLTEFPQLKSMQTEDRAKLNTAAEEFFQRVSNGEQNIESPNGTAAVAAAGWNSENKLVPRTHPVPRPGTQFPGNANDYSNPSGPADPTAT